MIEDFDRIEKDLESNNSDDDISVISGSRRKIGMSLDQRMG